MLECVMDWPCVSDTGVLQFALSTWMVMDAHQNAIRVAWTIHESQTGSEIATWVEAIVRKVKCTMPEWKPSCFMVDDADADINALR
jgi:hypothetical protein